MDCNKDEAMRAKEIAEKKMQSSDFEAARKIVLKARTLYPELENITQMLSVCDVYCSAQIRLPGVDKDWYGVLQVEKLADESTIKKQYRRLALILHPDKNRFPGAEGAFKLICEANALLSDTAKKSVYDNKIKVLTTNKSFQFNRQYGPQNISSNGYNSQNQSLATQFSPIFWTSCPYCRTNYQYPKQFVNRFLRCSNCNRGFTAYETSGPSGSAAKPSHQGAPPKPNVHQAKPDVFQAKVETNQTKPGIGVKYVKVPPTSRAGSQGTANMETVKPQPGARKRGGSENIKVASAAENLKTKETVNLNASSLRAEKLGVTSNGDQVHRESRKARNKSQNRERKVVLESSDDSGTGIENVTEQVNLGDAAARAQFARRSSRRRQQVSYNEANEDDYARPLKRVHATKEADGKEHGDNVHGKGSIPDNQNSFPTVPGYPKSAKKETGPTESDESLKHKKEDCDIEGEVRGVNGGRSSTPADTVEIDSDSDLDLSFNKSSGELNCPDPDFSDFDKLRHGSQFQVDQFWACYDTHDSMPRYYAKVKKVVSSSPLELEITWLEAVPINDSWKEWVDEELPVGCGSFKTGKPDKVSGNLTISHRVHCEKGIKRGSFNIYPREGEVWALYRDWDISWSSNTENHKDFKYEIVEVLSNFAEGSGIRVAYLNKISDFVSLFQRAVQNETNSFHIHPDELYRFSHCIPSFKMSGAEREGVPIGSFELDPASIPAKPEDLYYPSKANFECRDKDPGVGSSVPKYAGVKGKNVIPGGPCSPHKIVDLESTRGGASSLRRSPRGVKLN